MYLQSGSRFFRQKVALLLCHLLVSSGYGTCNATHLNIIATKNVSEIYGMQSSLCGVCGRCRCLCISALVQHNWSAGTHIEHINLVGILSTNKLRRNL